MILTQILEEKYSVSFVIVLEVFHWYTGFHCDKLTDWYYKEAYRMLPYVPLSRSFGIVFPLQERLDYSFSRQRYFY